MVTLIAATNEPWAIEPSLLRSGRLERAVLIGPLDYEGRLQLLCQGIGAIKVTGSGCKEVYATEVFDLESVATRTEGCTGADITLLLRRAAVLSFEAHHQSIKQEFLEEALKKTTPSVTTEELNALIEWDYSFRVRGNA